MDSAMFERSIHEIPVLLNYLFQQHIQRQEYADIPVGEAQERIYDIMRELCVVSDSDPTIYLRYANALSTYLNMLEMDEQTISMSGHQYQLPINGNLLIAYQDLDAELEIFRDDVKQLCEYIENHQDMNEFMMTNTFECYYLYMSSHRDRLSNLFDRILNCQAPSGFIANLSYTNNDT